MDYKEILKGIVNIINTTEKSDVGFANICSYVGENCPELKESEDEQMAKHIIDIVKCKGYDAAKDENFYAAEIAWLEKQGEKKVSWSEEDEYRAERLLGWLDTLANYIHHDAIVSLDLRRERMQQVEQLKTWLKSLKERIKGRIIWQQ